MTAARDSSGSDWPGKRLGLPDSGSRSVARLGRRIIAIAVDWALALTIAVIFFHYDLAGKTVNSNVWLVPGIFAVIQIIFISVLSGSIGHLLLGLRLVPLQPRWIGVVRPTIRTVLLSLAIPALIWDKDQRGLHDRWAGTVLVRK